MNYRPQKARREDRPDGTILLSSVHDLAPYPARTADWLHRWADERPDTVFLGERSGDGWREIRYAEALGMVRAIAAALLGRGLGPDTRILIVSGNGVDHGLLTLAAHYVGIPTVPVAEQYSLIPGAEVQLAQIAALIRPTLVFAEDAQRFGRAFALDALDGCDVITSRNATPGMTRFDDLLAGGSADIDAAAARVGPDDVIKILMTSGSTSAPKGVMTTQRMMCANQQMYIDALPFLSARPPRLLDWLPWNHVFGGSNNFNQMLANGGSLYIDDGKPTPALIGRTIENNRLMNGTIAYNVPIGFALLRDAMKTDDDLRRRYFEDLDMLFYAGASLPADVWQDLHAMGVEIRGQAPMMNTCWGLTETGPAAIFQAEPSDLPGVVGVPLAGVTAKLVPDGEGRFEVRVTGPSVMPGYFDDPDRTADTFDDEGFFISGDAMTWVDEDDPDKGLRFDGRISEDFKLTTGIWVRAAALRLELLPLLSGIAADLVVTGAGRDEVGLLIVPPPNLLATGALTDDRGACLGPDILRDLAARLASRPAQGSSNRVTRAMILSQPPSMADGEITAKGNLNYRKLLALRAALVDRLYAGNDPAVIVLN